MTIRHITHCLNPKLADLYVQATKLEEMNRLVRSFLPDNLKKHCSVGSFQQGCLNLVTHDAVWASQLRFILPELRDSLRSQAKLHQLASIKISVEGEQLNRPKKRIHSETLPTSPWQAILKLIESA